MDFIKDGGLNCVRHYLFEESHEIEDLARKGLQSPGKIVGQLMCVCKATDCWVLIPSSDPSRALLSCGCNGSSLPLYIGAPKKGNYSGGTCPSRCRLPHGRVGIGIGYPGAVPPNGTVDAERATEIVVISNCKNCGKTWTAWTLR